MSAMIRHIPARVVTTGRTPHRQWLGTRRQAAQRSPRGPPRARKGLELRARRALRRRDTAWACAALGMAGRYGLRLQLATGAVVHALQRKHRQIRLPTQPHAAAKFGESFG